MALRVAAALRRALCSAKAAPAAAAPAAAAEAPRVRVFVSETHNPLFNLATEEWMLRSLDTSAHTLFLWRNEPTVFIGRNQNPFAECNLDRMERDGVHLARRYSGGGAVYQDLGNTCFTFMSSKAGYSTKRNFEVLLDALRRCGVHGEQTGRNDMVVNGRKFSGSAFKFSAQSCMHHGTVMLSVDLDALSKYLTPSKAKLMSKGITSVRSRVVNLSEVAPGIDHARVSERVVDAFFDAYGARCELEVLDRDSLQDIPLLRAEFDKLADWRWRFGESPKFAHHLETRFDWGSVDLRLDTADGLIRDVVFFSDSLHPEVMDTVKAALLGHRYSAADITGALTAAERHFAERSLDAPAAEVRDLRRWVAEQFVA